MKLNMHLVLLSFGLSLFTNFTTINCAKYKAIPLDYLNHKVNQGSGISFDYKIFDKFACKKYLGRDKIISRGYQPVQISLVNNSDRCLSLSLNDFSFPCVSADEVADKVKFNMFARVFGWTVGALFMWPFVIGAIVEGVETPDANLDLCADYSKKALKNQIIAPGTSVNGLIFAANEQFNNSFSFTLIDSNSSDQFKFSAIPQTKKIKKRYMSA